MLVTRRGNWPLVHIIQPVEKLVSLCTVLLEAAGAIDGAE